MAKDYDHLWMGDKGGPWVLPDKARVDWVKENIPEIIPEDREGDGEFLIKM